MREGPVLCTEADVAADAEVPRRGDFVGKKIRTRAGERKKGRSGIEEHAQFGFGKVRSGAVAIRLSLVTGH